MTAYKMADLDYTTLSTVVTDHAHAEIHSGNRFYVLYSVADLGAMTTPDDMITIDFTTPNTTKWAHFTFTARGVAGWRVRLIEAPTGGAASPTGQKAAINRDRNSSTVSVITDGSTAGQINYDSTLATGGTTIWDEYLEGNTTSPVQASTTRAEGRDEILLKQNTKYQLSLYGTQNFPATLLIDWYEHTNNFEDNES